jgi:chemotaxis protein histidine kinase CheA
MSSIQSILIRTCMSSIQKELEQLEKWLGGSLPRPEPSPSTDSLLTAVERLSKQFEVQQHALNHIVDRLDILEGVRNEPCYMDLHDDPWLDHSPTQLQNEIIDPIEPLYHICKTETLFEPTASPLPLVQPMVQPMAQPLVQPMVEEQPVASLPVVEQEEEEEEHQEEEEQEEEEEEEEEEEQQKEKEEEEEQEQEEEEEEEQEQDEPKKEEQQQEEEEEDEEEDEGVELIEYKGVSYYKDSEGFIYRIEEDEQPSEIAIGYWKEKTNSIAFYKK